MPADTKSENLVQAVTEVSDRVSTLVRDEIDLAKAEVTQKAMSLARGTVAVLAGAVFGVFAIVMGLEAAAWALNAILVPGAGSIWEGFLIVFGVLAVFAVTAFMLAWRA
ncbi:MAG: phage holin family protein, partial [Solirubrobacterales bacterium]|nr:phage holin family protein [Solirubrobacterales bacterium]